MNHVKDIVWQSLSWPSIIMLRFEETRDGMSGKGFAIGRTDQNKPFAYEHTANLTSEWQIETVFIKSLLDGRSMALRYEAGRWHNGAGSILGEFDNIPFIDISISPFTNSLPIKQLVFEKDALQKIDMVYFDENDFSLRKVQQIYSKIDDKTYRYQDVEQDGFTAELTVDEDGLVINFEHLFERV